MAVLYLDLDLNFIKKSRNILCDLSRGTCIIITMRRILITSCASELLMTFTSYLYMCGVDVLFLLVITIRLIGKSPHCLQILQRLSVANASTSLTLHL